MQTETEDKLKTDFPSRAPNLRGLLLPLTTPFKSNGDVDTRGLRSNITKWNASGINGHVLLGSTGERVHLEEREYLHVIETARAEVPAGPDGLAFIVGAGQQSTRASIGEIKKAAALGADAVLVITPHYYRSSITQDSLITHYTAVAEAAPIPIILYSMPALTGIKIEPDTVARLSQHPNIIGVKDSSADIEGFKRTDELVNGGLTATQPSRREFALLTGNGTVLYDALQVGADGAILAVGCVAPRLCQEIIRLCRAGENEQAATLQNKLTPLARAVTTDYGIGGLKAALDMIGYVGGAVRAPLQSPGEEARARIAQLLVEAIAQSDIEPSNTADRAQTLPRNTPPITDEDSSLVPQATRA